MKQAMYVGEAIKSSQATANLSLSSDMTQHGAIISKLEESILNLRNQLHPILEPEAPSAAQTLSKGKGGKEESPILLHFNSMTQSLDDLLMLVEDTSRRLQI